MFISIGLVTLIAWTFFPVTRNDFVNLDDPVYIYQNPHVQKGLTGAGISWALTTLQGGFWHPLTWLSIMVDCQLYGLRPGGHHLISLVLHSANTVLLLFLLRRMTGALWRSAAVAALFALHPLHVESVAWAAERKDVLSAFFWMLALLMYVGYATRQLQGTRWRDRTFYAAALCFFICGLLSKSMVVTLPFVLLLLEVVLLLKRKRETKT